MKVYSPSQTLEWSRCPFLWATSYKAGWRQEVVDKRDIAASLGVAFGAALECYNVYAKTEGVEVAREKVGTQAVERGLAVLAEEWGKWEQQGLDRSALALVGDVQGQLAEAVEYAVKHDPTPLDWKVVCAEQAMPEHGNARADVVYELPTGERVVRDYKFTLSVLPRYVDERMSDYATHPQSYHYCWMHGAGLFLPTLVIASPRPSLREVAVQRTGKDVAQWLESQAAKWSQMQAMEEGRLPVWKSDVHKSQYGKCVLHDFCLTYEADESRLEGIGFVKVERKR